MVRPGIGGVHLKQTLVIGAGIAGMSAALSLAERGVFVNLIDSEPAIGGMSRELSCKGIRTCVRCDVCLATDRLYDVAQSERIRVFPNTTVRSVSGGPGRFRVTLERSPNPVDEASCTGCGVCVEACPVEGSAIHSPSSGVPLTYMIDPTMCLRWKGGECNRCVEICPRQAIDFSRKGSTKRMEVGAIVVATGSEPFDPDQEPRYRHDQLPGVISSLEAERILNLEGRLPEEWKRVAFIQCVGSRDRRMGAEYCSKVCCKYSRGIALQLREVHPDLEITFFFMDWRPYDLRDSGIREWAAGDERIRAIRSRPAEVLPSLEGKPIVRYVGEREEVIEDEFDLVILSIGMRPSIGLEKISEALGLEINPQGFILTSMERPSLTSRPGVFASGCCTGPKDIEESAMEGIIAAGEAASFLEGLR